MYSGRQLELTNKTLNCLHSILVKFFALRIKSWNPKSNTQPFFIRLCWIFKWPDFCSWVGQELNYPLHLGGFQLDFKVVSLASRLVAKQKAGQCCLGLLQLCLFAVRKEQKQVKISGLWYRGAEEGLDTLSHLIVTEYSLKGKFLCRSGC